MNKLVFLIAASLMFTTVNANDKVISIGNLYSPGGGMDIAVNALEPSLNRQGYELRKEFYKSCKIAYDQVRADKVDLIIASPANVSFDRSENSEHCQALDSVSKDFGTVTAFRSSTFFMCSAPGFGVSSIEQIQKNKGKKVRVGVTDNFNVFFVREFFKHSAPDVEYVLLMYPGTSKVKAAMIAGDVDIGAGSSMPAVAQEIGGACFGASNKKNGFGVPFYGGTEFVYSEVLLGKTKSFGDGKRQALANALKSDEFKEMTAKLKVFHEGIGAGVTAEETNKTMLKLERMINGK